jgi:hypothetical protein
MPMGTLTAMTNTPRRKKRRRRRRKSRRCPSSTQHC